MSLIKAWRKKPSSIQKYQFMYHFLPHPALKKRATLLSNKAFIIYCLLFLFIALSFRVIPKFFPGVLGYASNITVSDLLEYTNTRRKSEGLSSLKLNSSLSEAAHQKALDMFKNGYWAHVSPSGKEPWDFILGANYDYLYAGENLAKNFSNSKDVVEAWYESPTHRENLLSSNYDEIGFAVVNGVLDGYETTLVVQMFGRPRNADQIATVEEEKVTLKQIEVQDRESAKTVPSINNNSKSVSIPASPSVLPAVDISTATRGLSFGFGGFLLLLLSLDVWYSRKVGALKFTGHTFAHITILVAVLVSIWFVLKPGLII